MWVDILIQLVAAHLLAEFILQPATMVKRKVRPDWLLLHSVIVAAVSVLLTGRTSLPLIGGVLCSHFLIDMLRVHAFGESPIAFLVDQALHLTALLFIAVAFRETDTLSLWGQVLTPQQQRVAMRILILAAGYILCCSFGGVLIAGLVTRLLPEQPDEGIAGAGRVIGLLERAIVMTLILADAMSGIGFLIAAKSILRFGQSSRGGETDVRAERRASEYIIIGTFLSFGWGLVTALLTVQLLRWYAIAA